MIAAAKINTYLSSMATMAIIALGPLLCVPAFQTVCPVFNVIYQNDLFNFTGYYDQIN